MLFALSVTGLSLRMGAQFVTAAAAMAGLVTMANAAITWSGAAVVVRVVGVVLLALILSGAGLRFAAARMRAMEPLQR